MSKDNLFKGQPIFSQVLNLIPFSQIPAIVKEQVSDRYVKRFTTEQHLITMLYGVLSGCNSLREVCSGIVSFGEKISHCKLDYAIPKSTLSDANKKRSANVFEKLYYASVKHLYPSLSDSPSDISSNYRLFAIDSTTISLFQSIFECVGRHPKAGKRKGGINKSHQKLDIESGIPVHIWHSDAKKHDSVFFHMDGVMKPNEVAVMDRAYNKYSKFAEWSQKSIYFVTRMKQNAKEVLVRELDLSDSDSDEVLRDAIVKFEYVENGLKKEVELRMVTFYDKEKDRCFYFLTNLMGLTATEVCNIYKKRWEIELFFKKIKQNFPLTYFYGDNQNAIEIQIWCTLIASLLVSHIKTLLKKKWGFSNLMSIISKHLFSYIKMIDFLNNMELYAKEYIKERRLNREKSYQSELIFT
jgi:hypothetical protein